MPFPWYGEKWYRVCHRQVAKILYIEKRLSEISMVYNSDNDLDLLMVGNMCQKSMFHTGFFVLHTPTSILEVVSVYKMKSQGIGGVVETGALQRFLPPSSQIKSPNRHVSGIFLGFFWPTTQGWTHFEPLKSHLKSFIVRTVKMTLIGKGRRIKTYHCSVCRGSVYVSDRPVVQRDLRMYQRIWQGVALLDREGMFSPSLSSAVKYTLRKNYFSELHNDLWIKGI